MSSSAITALFRSSLLCISATVMGAVCPPIALAEPMQGQSAATVPIATTVSPSEPGASLNGASTVLKTLPATVQPAAQSATVSAASREAAPSLPAGAGPSPANAVGGEKATTPATAALANPASSDRSQEDVMGLLSPAQRRTYLLASSVFASFCHDWERLLHEREVNNLDHLSWREDGGMETATYTGYGKVESCECKESKEGLPIGKIGYEEISYSIAGKTVNDARRAVPKLIHQIKTLEIFSWEKDRWFY